MKAKNYSETITVTATPEAAYNALTTGFADWWTKTDNDFTNPGDRVRFTFPPNVSHWTFEATRLEPNRTVELKCVEAYHKILDKPAASESEWLGSITEWTVTPHGDETEIVFSHKGLTPDLDCFEVCKLGWDTFFVESLKAYLNTGVGKPYRAG